MKNKFTNSMQIESPNKKLEYILVCSIAILAFIVYVSTLCPTVNFIDSGELATVSATLGIAHPTGYPLFTLIGWIFAHLPFELRVITKLNLMAATFCSVGLAIFFRFLVFFINEFFCKKEKEDLKNRWFVFLPAAFGTLVLAFSETYWSQALSIEVYSLHVCFLSCILLLFAKGVQEEYSLKNKSDAKNYSSIWIVFALVLGLSFTNHMTTILLAPAFLYLFFYVHGFGLRAWKKIVWLIIPFTAGLSIYLYFPYRASQHPIMNWGNPIDLERFFWHFGAKQYRVWIFSSTDSAAKQLNYFINSIGSEFGYFPLLFSVAGIIYLFKYRKNILVFTALLFLGCVLYAINYDIHDIDSYFLLAYFTIGIWAGLGAYHVILKIKNLRQRWVFSYLIVASCFVILYLNYNKVDESKNYLVEDYTKDMFNSIKPGGIIISYQWDYFVSAAYYFQLVENYRSDVVVIDKELLRRSWYYNQLGDRYPWLITNSKKEIDGFLHELYKFEHELPYNPEIIEHYYTQLIKSFIAKNYSTHPIYVTQEIEENYSHGYTRIPSGLAFRLYSDSALPNVEDVQFNFRKPTIQNIYSDGIQSLYARAYFNLSAYANLVGDIGKANYYVDKALEVEPNLTQAMFLKEQLKRR